MKLVETNGFKKWVSHLNRDIANKVNKHLANTLGGRTAEQMRTPGQLPAHTYAFERVATAGEAIYHIAGSNNEDVVFGLHGEQVVLLGALARQSDHWNRSRAIGNLAQQLTPMIKEFTDYKKANPLPEVVNEKCSRAALTKPTNHRHRVRTHSDGTAPNR